MAEEMYAVNKADWNDLRTLLQWFRSARPTSLSARSAIPPGVNVQLVQVSSTSPTTITVGSVTWSAYAGHWYEKNLADGTLSAQDAIWCVFPSGFTPSTGTPYDAHSQGADDSGVGIFWVGSAAAGTLTVEDGATTVTSATTLLVDRTTGGEVTDLGGGEAGISFVSASFTQMGMVDLSDQYLGAGIKWTDGIALSPNHTVGTGCILTDYFDGSFIALFPWLYNVTLVSRDDATTGAVAANSFVTTPSTGGVAGGSELFYQDLTGGTSDRQTVYAIPSAVPTTCLSHWVQQGTVIQGMSLDRGKVVLWSSFFQDIGGVFTPEVGDAAYAVVDHTNTLFTGAYTTLLDGTVVKGGLIITAGTTGATVAIGSTVTSSTNYNIVSIDGSGKLSEISPSTSGDVLTSNGTGAAATFQVYTGTSSLVTTGTLTSGATGAGFTVALGTSTITGTLAQVNGGTGIDTSGATDGQILIGKTSDHSLNLATLTGTVNRLTVANSGGGITLNVSTNYAGGTAIVTLGTVTTGTWQATAIGQAYGGTGIDSSGVTDGQILIGKTSDHSLNLATLTGTTNRLTVTNAGGSITLDVSSNYAGGTNITTLGTVATGTWAGTTITIAHGGTGQTTATAAFDALAPGSPAKGDVIVYSGSHWVRLPVGSDTKVLTANSAATNGVDWESPSAGSGTVTSIVAGTGLTGGTITTSGTIALATTIPQAETIKVTDTATNSATTVLTIAHDTSGTAAAGFGETLLWQLQDSTTADQSAADDTITWATATHASRKARRVFNVYDTSAREALRLEANGSAPMIGFLGTSASAQLSSPDIGTALVTFGLASGVPTFAGANVTGTVSTASSCSGNAATATALQTGRTINGTTFDGTANIVVTAAAGTLTGTTLNSSVVTSSLTTVGTIGTGVWHGTKIDLAHGGTNADLSATGGAHNLLFQTSSGGAITVAALAYADLPGTLITSSSNASGSEPGSPNAGDLFFPSNGVNLDRYNGSGWQPWGPIFRLSGGGVILDPGTWGNQGSASVTTVTNQYIFFSAPSNGSADSLRLRYQSIGTTGAILGFLPLFTPGTGAQYLGIALYESSSAKAIFLNIAQNTIPALAISVYYYTALGTFSTAIKNNLTWFWTGGMVWMKAYNDGTNINLQVSADGQNWTTILAEAKATHFTSAPDKVGFAMDPFGAPCAITVNSWQMI